MIIYYKYDETESKLKKKSNFSTIKRYCTIEARAWLDSRYWITRLFSN